MADPGAGQLPGFRQAGWQVSYPGQGSDPDAPPGRMRAEHPQLVLVAAFRDWLPLEPGLQ